MKGKLPDAILASLLETLPVEFSIVDAEDKVLDNVTQSASCSYHPYCLRFLVQWIELAYYNQSHCGNDN